MSDDFRLVNSGTDAHGQTVRSEGQAEVFAVTVDEFENVSARSRLAFSWTIVPANFSAAETLLLIQNNNASLTLHITHAIVETDNSSLVQVHLTDRAALTPAGGVVVTGVSWNQTAPRVAEALARSNETVPKKIRQGSTRKIPNLLIVGEREQSVCAWCVRRDPWTGLSTMPMDGSRSVQ